MTEPPLLDLFFKLRQVGFPLGLDEYRLLIEALRKGFGLPDREALRRLCHVLWVKSDEERNLFDLHFNQVRFLPETVTPATSTPMGDIPTKPAPGAGKEEETERDEIRTPPEALPPSPDPVAESSMEIRDEVQASQTVQAIRGGANAQEESLLPDDFNLLDDYLPIRQRELKQSWRRLRHWVREGPSEELDIDATVRHAAQTGFLLEPILVPRRRNLAELVLFIDRRGSMTPFHELFERFEATAANGGRLGATRVFYFQNCPINFLYRDRALIEGCPLLPTIRTFHAERASVLILSDAGAARGGYNPDRVRATRRFLNHLRGQTRRIAWLNPMPRDRWEDSTAGDIAETVNMFEATRQGVNDALTHLRKQALNLHEAARW